MARKKYKGMNDVPIGTEMIHRDKKGNLIEITHTLLTCSIGSIVTQALV